MQHQHIQVARREALVCGQRLSYVESGSGDPWLFLHGNPTNSNLWRNIVPQLSSRGRCIALDLAGMGDSAKGNIEYSLLSHATFVEAFIEQLELERLTLVMHDAGSFAGFRYASRRSHNVAGLAFMEAVLAPVMSWEMLPPTLRPYFERLRSAEGWSLIRDENLFIEQILARGLVGEDRQDTLELYRQPFRDPEHRRAMSWFPRQLPFDGEPREVSVAVREYVEFLRESSLPKLLIHANPGLLNPPELVKWVATRFPKLSCVDLGSGGHFLPEEKPAQIAQALLHWYDTVVQASA